MRQPTLLLVLSAASLLLSASSAHAFKKFAQAEGKSCAYCHVNPAGAGKRNYRGLFYKAHNNSFAGFDDAAEAKKAGVEIGPEPTPPPRSQTPPPVESATTAAAAVNLLTPVTNAAAWRLQQREMTKATLSVEENALKVVVTQVGPNDGLVQVFHILSGTQVQEGARYTLRFRAKADADARPLRVMAQSMEPFHTIGLNRTFTLGTDYKDFTHTFTAQKVNPKRNKVPAFVVGAKTGTIWIADVALTAAVGNAAAAAAPAVPKPTPPPPAPVVDAASIPDFGVATFAGIEFVRIPAGAYRRGTTDEQRAELEKAGQWAPMNAVEQPAREVRITRPFFLSKTEVTQEQWKQVMGEDPKLNPSAFKGPDLPVDSVTWNDAQAFVKALGEKTKDGARYRLPTEAEWEYAARAGSDGLYGLGAGKTAITRENLPEFAWYSVNAQNKTQPVGKKKPNAWGLHDMLGNVWEWCEDAYATDFYASGPAENPLSRNPVATERVFRGGCWYLDTRAQRPALRAGNLPTFKSQYVGLRLVRELPQ